MSHITPETIENMVEALKSLGPEELRSMFEFSNLCCHDDAIAIVGMCRIADQCDKLGDYDGC